MTIPIEQLLKIPNIRVLSFEMDDHKIRCYIESTLDHSICHKCGEKATEFYCSGETLVLRHLPICEREVYLHLRTKRYRCLRCDDHPTTTEQCDWYDAKSGCTKAYADFLLRELVNSTTSDVAIKHRVSYDVVRGLLRRYIKGENVLDDQLVLGIKGTLSVVELKVLWMRLLQGQEEKARRGKLFKRLPVGYVLDGDGRVAKSPDLRVQEAIALVLAKFRQLWSIRQTFQWFRDHDVLLPVNPAQGGKMLVWQPPTQAFVREILVNPFYAGAYTA